MEMFYFNFKLKELHNKYVITLKHGKQLLKSHPAQMVWFKQEKCTTNLQTQITQHGKWVNQIFVP